MATKTKTGRPATYTVEVRNGAGGLVRLLDGGLPRGLPDRHRAARVLVWWLVDNGHAGRLAASRAGREVEATGLAKLPDGGHALLITHEGGRR